MTQPVDLPANVALPLTPGKFDLPGEEWKRESDETAEDEPEVFFRRPEPGVGLPPMPGLEDRAQPLVPGELEVETGLLRPGIFRSHVLMM